MSSSHLNCPIIEIILKVEQYQIFYKNYKGDNDLFLKKIVVWYSSVHVIKEQVVG